MTTAELTQINVANPVFDALTQTLVSMSEQDQTQSLSDLADVFTAARNYKGHSRTLALDESNARTLRSVIAQSDINETRTKTVTDKLDAAFPESATAVVEERPDETEKVDAPKQPETVPAEPTPAPPVVAPNAPAVTDPRPTPPAQPATAPAAPGIEQGEPNAEGVFNPDMGRTTLKAIRMSKDRTIPNISQTGLITTVELPDLSTMTIGHGKGNALRYRSKARASGAFVSIIDLTEMSPEVLKSNLSEQANGAKAMVVCELHSLGAPLPSVDPGKLYLRQPERFCSLCAALIAQPKAEPEQREPAKRGRKPKTEEAPVLRDSVKVDATPSEPAADAVVHPSDERASEDDWNRFSREIAQRENATVIWNANRHYAIMYGEGKGVDVYVNANGVESRWRIGTDNFTSLDEAKAALAD
jgi:hypothetical protein